MDTKSFSKKDVLPEGFHIASGGKTIFTLDMKSSSIFDKPDSDPIPVTVDDKQVMVIPWGANNDLPNQILSKVSKSEILSNGLNFNTLAGYGDGVMPVYFKYSNGKREIFPYEFMEDEFNEGGELKTNNGRRNLDKWKETWDALSVFQEMNDLSYYITEILSDLNYFHMAFAEIIIDKKGEKIVQLMAKNAAFTRFEKANDNGIIENVLFSAKWAETKSPDKKYLSIIPIVDPRRMIYDLRQKISKKAQFKYFVPLLLPSPGTNYYPKTPWYSVFESGWYDIALNIPKLKKAILENQMTLKYHVQLAHDYFQKIFNEERIVDAEKKKARIALEYQNINDFLTNAENSGKSIISKTEYLGNDYKVPQVTISAIDNPFKGGEYIEDSEEGSNIMHYALGVHPSIVGSSPGKNKTINGTEARELFLIKQSMMKPLRDYALRPLYLIKAINNWDPALHWVIPNVELTTLDTGKQTQKVVL